MLDVAVDAQVARTRFDIGDRAGDGVDLESANAESTGVGYTTQGLSNVVAKEGGDHPGS